jgi:hypothetical protein
MVNAMYINHQAMRIEEPPLCGFSGVGSLVNQASQIKMNILSKVNV